MADRLSKLVQSTFDIYGLMMTKKLRDIVVKHLQNNSDTDPECWITKVAEQILTQNLATPHVELENIKLAIKECIKPESTLKETETVFNVIDVFTVPKVVYDVSKKKYILRKVDYDLFSEAMYKSLVFKERLDLLWYRTLNHDSFLPSKFGKTNNKILQLVPIEYLLSESKTINVCVMGLLAQLTEGQFFLEDYGGSVKVNLKDAKFSSSLIMEGSIVIAEGEYHDTILKVKNIGFPPVSSKKDRVTFGDTNTFGGPHPTSLKLSEKLKVFENTHKNEFIIFISDFWVDSEIVLNKFKVILTGFSDNPPFAIVLCGHFLSSPSNATSVKTLKDGFKKLAALIAEYPLIQQNSKFVFVPGPYDLSAPKILPRLPLPKHIMKDLLESVPGTILATNPCRIQYCTKEIVVFREDMLSKLCRNTLYYPKQKKDQHDENKGHELYEAFAKSIIRQSHLSPLLFSMMPVYWKYDQALQLYPTPDLIVVCDDFQPYVTEYCDCQVINPGPFKKSNFSFQLYCPAENKVEASDVPSDDN